MELQVDDEKLNSKEFKALWSRINAKSVYVVDFDTDELVKKAIAALDSKLRVAKIYFKIESGSMGEIKSKEQLKSGQAFAQETSSIFGTKQDIVASNGVTYDLVGRLVESTGLTRKDVIWILTGIDKFTFDQFKYNPEEFILKSSQLINDEKATSIIEQSHTA